MRNEHAVSHVQIIQYTGTGMGRSVGEEILIYVVDRRRRDKQWPAEILKYFLETRLRSVIQSSTFKS